jgi:4-hydroxybenzoyl-CoA reductase subunit beta
MLPLPLFQHHAPRTLDEAIDLMSALGDRARLVAGGTDLVPNMKHGLVEPEHVVSLQGVHELRGIDVRGDHLEIGAMTTIQTVADDPRVREGAPALAEAASLVAGPHHRRMGTIGGNVCLDTRCLYYNQTYFWREALGFCLKKDGTKCHVVESGKNCVAAASNDTAPTLMVLEGVICLVGPKGPREIAADDFYVADGIYNTVRDPGEIVTKIRVPLVDRRRSSFEKLRRRGAIDYPLLNVAARLDLEGGTIADADLVISALAARPKRVKQAAKLGTGKAPSEALFTDLAEAAYKQCHPLTNIDQDGEWRRAMVRSLVKKALARAAGL